eukprot:Skav230221  [mRNA]  locus=scaffold1558:21581:21899:+ [translate_table: standard]
MVFCKALLSEKALLFSLWRCCGDRPCVFAVAMEMGGAASLTARACKISLHDLGYLGDLGRSGADRSQYLNCH